MFEEVLSEKHDEVFYIKGRLLDLGALSACMTGSGPTVLGLFSQQTQAEAAAEALRRPDRQVFVARPV